MVQLIFEYSGKNTFMNYYSVVFTLVADKIHTPMKDKLSCGIMHVVIEK